MRFMFNDCGRAAAGCKGQARECVCRSVAIASGRPYAEVYAALAKQNEYEPDASEPRMGQPAMYHIADIARAASASVKGVS